MLGHVHGELQAVPEARLPHGELHAELRGSVPRHEHPRHGAPREEGLRDARSVRQHGTLTR